LLEALKIRRLPERGRTGSIPVSGTIIYSLFQAIDALKSVFFELSLFDQKLMGSEKKLRHFS